METSSLRRREGKPAGIFSNQAKQHTDARRVVLMTPAFSVVDAMILPTTLGTWFTSAYHPAIVAAVTVEILRRGDFLFIAQYIRLSMDLSKRRRGRQLACLTN